MEEFFAEEVQQLPLKQTQHPKGQSLGFHILRRTRKRETAAWEELFAAQIYLNRI